MQNKTFMDYLVSKVSDADHHELMTYYGDITPRETLTVDMMELYYENFGGIKDGY